MKSSTSFCRLVKAMHPLWGEQKEKSIACEKYPKTFRTIYGYNELVRILRPSRKQREDLRDLPTYSIPEAATFLAIPPSTLSYWFSGTRRILHPTGDYRAHSLLSFKDLA